MPFKFIKQLRKYVENTPETFEENIQPMNFVFESEENDECTLSYRLAKFILYLIDNADSLAFDLEKEQDYNRLLRMENKDLRADYQDLIENFEEYKETGGKIVIDTSGSNILS